MGVFIRSLATHGALGGLSRAASDSVDLMDAAGKQVIFVETVGIGQDEVDVMQTVHTTIVVSVPGLGDEIQTLKAGILEIADIHVVNKADREGADRIHAELRSMLSLSGANGRYPQPPIISCVALRDEGVSSLLDTVVDHLAILRSSGEFERRHKRMVRERVLGIVRDLVSEASARQECNCDDLLERVVRRELAPYAGGRAMLARLVNQQGRQLHDV
jgi:LAO/AO transport system kinase